MFIVYATNTPDALLPMEIGRVLGLQADGGMPSAAQLSGQSLLLILDGLDNTPAAAQMVADLLASAPGLTLLVTTAAPLRIEGEHVLTIGGLELPASPEDVERAAAGALLVAEAQRADMRFTVGTGARPYLVQLCTLVDGLPRGLILAARALSETSPANLVRSIESAGTLETLEAFDRPRDGGMKASDEDARAGVARRTAPLALICTPDANAVALVERLREEGMIVCVTHDLHGCLRVATAVGPDVIMIDPRLPRRLEQLLLAHPACSGASIRWLSDPAAVPPSRVQSIVA